MRKQISNDYLINQSIKMPARDAPIANFGVAHMKLCNYGSGSTKSLDEITFNLNQEILKTHFC